jgi:hypothetical protein
MRWLLLAAAATGAGCATSAPPVVERPNDHWFQLWAERAYDVSSSLASAPELVRIPPEHRGTAGRGALKE